MKKSKKIQRPKRRFREGWSIMKEGRVYVACECGCKICGRTEKHARANLLSHQNSKFHKRLLRDKQLEEKSIKQESKKTKQEIDNEVKKILTRGK